MLDWLLGVAAGLALVGLVIGASHLVTLRRRHRVAATGTLRCAAALRGATAPYPIRAQRGRLTVSRDQISFTLRSGRQIDLSHVGLQLTRVRLAGTAETSDDDLSRMLLCQDGNGTPVALAVGETDAPLLRELLTRSATQVRRGQVTTTSGRPRPWRTWPAVVTILSAVPLAVLAGLLLTGTMSTAQVVAGDEGCEAVWTDPYLGVERRRESGCLGGRTQTTVVTPAPGLPDVPIRLDALLFVGSFLGGGLLLALAAVPWRMWAWRREDPLRTAGLPIDPPTQPVPARSRAEPRPWESRDLTWAAATARAEVDRVVGCAPRIGDRLRRWRDPLKASTVWLIPILLILAGWPAFTGAMTELMQTRPAEATVVSVLTTYPPALEELRIGFTTESGEQIDTSVIVHGWSREPAETLAIEYATARPQWVRAASPNAGHRLWAAAATVLIGAALGGAGLVLSQLIRPGRAARRARRTGRATTVRHALFVTDAGEVRALLFAQTAADEHDRRPIAVLDLAPTAVVADLPPVGTGVLHGGLSSDRPVVYEAAGCEVLATELAPITSQHDVTDLVAYLNAEAELYQTVW